jgi:hypothetical protein
VGCNSADEVDSGSAKAPYDPSKPVTVTDFMPDSGRLREKVIIKGSNFGNDKSKITVFFNDGLVDRKSTIIGIDNNTIYCLAPRQEPGSNRIKVVTTYGEADTATFSNDRTFAYSQAENVTTITGGTQGTDDGTLAEAKFGYLHGIGALGDEAILVFTRNSPTTPSVRYVSVPEDRVITVHSGFEAAKPAVSKDKSTVYAVGWKSPHVLYRYDRSTGWSPQRIGQLSGFSGAIRSLCFGDSEDYLYFIDGNEKFGRYNLKAKMGENPVEIVANALIETTNNSPISVHVDGTYMIYNHFDGYFYLTEQEKMGVYRMKLTFDEATSKASVAELVVYAGFKTDGVQDGYLDDCSFKQPNGLTLDDMGNIFVIEGWSVNVLRKISTADGYVSTITGQAGVGGRIDGLPSEARLESPYDVANDGEGNYWIVEGWGLSVRKYAIE